MADNILQKLIKVQSTLKAPKNQYNSFGKYNYRSCEDILEGAKPLCCENGLLLTISDEIVNIGNRYYVKATAKVSDGEKDISVSALAREEENKKGMDGSQVTGAASSYARKYALNGLFAIDDTKDADVPKQEPKKSNTGNNTHGLLVKISEKAKKCQLSSEDVIKIISMKFKKNGSKELTMQECSDLLNNFDKYLDEYITAKEF